MFQQETTWNFKKRCQAEVPMLKLADKLSRVGKRATTNFVASKSNAQGFGKLDCYHIIVVQVLKNCFIQEIAERLQTEFREVRRKSHAVYCSTRFVWIGENKRALQTVATRFFHASDYSLIFAVKTKRTRIVENKHLIQPTQRQNTLSKSRLLYFD